MILERADFQRAVEQRKHERVRQREREIRIAAQAVVPTSALVGTQEWDYFLSQLQAEIDRLEQVLMVLRDAAESDPSFAYEDLARNKAQRLQVATQIETLQLVRDLPKQIIEQGERATLVLQQYADE